MKYYLGLIITVIISFLAICQFEILVFGEQNPDDILPAFWQVFIPGLAFSMFVLLLVIRYLNILNFILSLIVLLGLYYFSFYLSFLSYGIGTPVFGLIGAVIITALVGYELKATAPQGKFALFGFLSVIPGIGLLFMSGNQVSNGVCFGLIIGLWQLVVGALLIQQVELVSQNPKTPVKSDVAEE